MNELLDRLKIGLGAVGLKFQERGSEELILYFSGLDNYRDSDGDPRVQIVVTTSRDRVSLSAPMAWRVPDGSTRAAVMETCLRLQWRYFAIRFEFDHIDGELRLSHHFSAGALPEPHLFPHILRQFVDLIDHLHEQVQPAITDGVLFEPDDDPDVSLSFPDGLPKILSELAELSPEQLERLLDAIREGAPT